MKQKKRLGVLLAVLLVLLCGCSSSASGRMIKKQTVQVKEMFEEDQSFVLCIVRDDCDTCNAYKETLKQLASDYDLPIYYIVITEEIMTEDEDMDDLIYNYLYYLENVPTTYIVKQGRVSDYQEGDISYDYLVEWLTGYGFIEE